MSLPYRDSSLVKLLLSNLISCNYAGQHFEWLAASTTNFVRCCWATDLKSILFKLPSKADLEVASCSESIPPVHCSSSSEIDSHCAVQTCLLCSLPDCAGLTYSPCANCCWTSSPSCSLVSSLPSAKSSCCLELLCVGIKPHRSSAKFAHCSRTSPRCAICPCLWNHWPWLCS